MSTETDREEELPGRVLFWEGLRASLGRTPVWLVTWGVLTLLALVVALPWYDELTSITENRYEPGSLIAQLDRNFRVDHASTLDVLNTATGRAGAILVFVSMLIGVFFAGGWLQSRG